MSLEIRNNQLYFNWKTGEEALEEVREKAPELYEHAEYLNSIITIKSWI